jgi:nucleotide-binding universal stress UspA family protein
MMKTNRLNNLTAPRSLAPSKLTSNLRIFNAPNHAQRPALFGDLRISDSRIKSILVPLDGSAYAEQAIPLALGIAEQSRAVLHVVHVVAPVEVLDPYDALYFPDASLAALKRDKHRYLADIVQQVSARSSVFMTSRVIDGRAVSPSLDSLPGLDADLIVMATHGRGAFARFFSGSVAHSVLQRVSVPLILVRGRNAPVNLEAHTIDHILLPLDGTKGSEKVLDPILDLGMFPSARNTLLHVVPLEPKHVVRGYALRTEWVPSRRRWITGMQYLHPFARKLIEAGRRVHTKVVSSDEPIGQVALRFAEELDVGLVAVAYHRQWPIARLLWPSFPEHLFRTCARPLLFVPVEAGL